ncbi:MAG: hypothetical protein AUK53_02785 [Betaproteobacteria bacterium CG2_30_59_46]|nr:MAG: hypothetical protein AUK53_02785 [Betaproteobacteria bacterium CG2_30_59_46]
MSRSFLGNDTADLVRFGNARYHSFFSRVQVLEASLNGAAPVQGVMVALWPTQVLGDLAAMLHQRFPGLLQVGGQGLASGYRIRQATIPALVRMCMGMELEGAGGLHNLEFRPAQHNFVGMTCGDGVHAGSMAAGGRSFLPCRPIAQPIGNDKEHGMHAEFSEYRVGMDKIVEIAIIESQDAGAGRNFSSGQKCGQVVEASRSPACIG